MLVYFQERDLDTIDKSKLLNLWRYSNIFEDRRNLPLYDENTLVSYQILKIVASLRENELLGSNLINSFL